MWVNRGERWSPPDAQRQPPGFSPPDVVMSSAIRGHDNVVRQAWLVLPGGVTGSLPVVLCPHPFGFTAIGNLFGEPAGPRTLVDVPGVAAAARRHGVATLTVAAEGARLSGVSLGWPANLDAYVAGLESAVETGIPLDVDRVTAAGLSMGGQEAIMLACRHPHLVKAVAVQNAVTDLAAWHQHLSRSAFGANHAAAILRELASDGIPLEAAWAERSPLSHVPAASGMRLQVRLNDLDSVVPAVEQGRAYAAALQDGGTAVDVVDELPPVIDPRDPGRSAHEYVNWDAILTWVNSQAM